MFFNWYTKHFDSWIFFYGISWTMVINTIIVIFIPTLIFFAINVNILMVLTDDVDYWMDQTCVISRRFSCPFMVGYFTLKARKNGLVLPNFIFSWNFIVSTHLNFNFIGSKSDEDSTFFLAVVRPVFSLKFSEIANKTTDDVGVVRLNNHHPNNHC